MAIGAAALNNELAVWMKDMSQQLMKAKELSTRQSDDVQAAVDAAATNNTIVTDTQLTKLQWNQAAGILADFIAFMENGAVATQWRRPIANQIWNAGQT